MYFWTVSENRSNGTQSSNRFEHFADIDPLLLPEEFAITLWKDRGDGTFLSTNLDRKRGLLPSMMNCTTDPSVEPEPVPSEYREQFERRIGFVEIDGEYIMIFSDEGIAV